MKWTFAGLAVTTAILMSGCNAVGQKVQLQTPFTEAQFAGYEKKGSGKVYGQAFIKTKGGDVKKLAGSVIIMAPYNEYTIEIENAYTKSPRTDLVGIPQAYDNYVRKYTTDSEGNFEFSNVPPGKYFIRTRDARMVIPGQYFSTWEVVHLSDVVEIKDGEEKRVVLNKVKSLELMSRES